MTEPTLAEIETIARQAGVILKARFESGFQVNHKGVIDLVTDVDREAEAFILQALETRFPGGTIYAEESAPKNGDNGHTWYIDPIDGTVNYAHGVPVFSVSMAYAQNGRVQLGVVYDPMQEECFTAARGRGAWLNGRPLHVSAASTLSASLLATGFPYDVWENPRNNLDHYARFTVRTQGVRRLGSAALDLCYVAAGRFDGFWELYLKPWDIAAGGLIAEEAGAIVTDVDGGHEYLTPNPSLLAANPTLHPQMLAVLKEGDI